MQAAIPFAWYADREVLHRERERIFAHAWQYVAHTDELEPGSQLAAVVGDVPVVVTRGRDGALHAFGERRAPAGVDTWGPFVFVNPDPDASPLAEALGEIPEQIRDLAGVADVLPAPAEDPLVLEAEHVRVAVPAPRDRLHVARV